MSETCFICRKEKGQPPDRCPGHYDMPSSAPPADSIPIFPWQQGPLSNWAICGMNHYKDLSIMQFHILFETKYPKPTIVFFDIDKQKYQLTNEAACINDFELIKARRTCQRYNELWHAFLAGINTNALHILIRQLAAIHSKTVSEKSISERMNEYIESLEFGKQSVAEAMRERCADAIPKSWCDPLLTGPTAVLNEHSYNGNDIERFCAALRRRINSLSITDNEE